MDYTQRNAHVSIINLCLFFLSPKETGQKEQHRLPLGKIYKLGYIGPGSNGNDGVLETLLISRPI